MRNDDVLAQLRAADPVARTDLSRIDPGALSALREGITMTTSEATSSAKRAPRIGRRGIAVVGISAVLVGGGAAYAAHQQFLWGDIEGWNCQYSPTEDAISAIDLTGDPIADCARYVAEAGLPPMTDPVAFTSHNATWVAPADQVPQDATRLVPASRDDATIRELEASLSDIVDGGLARCPSVEAATALGHSEIDRLGLAGWTVVTRDAEPAPEGVDQPCASAGPDIDDQTIVVWPSSMPDFEGPTSELAALFPLRDALRTGISGSCVSAADARGIADAALGDLDFEPLPTTTVIDESVRCARVDMEVGGSVQVTVYGPTVARP